MIKKIKNLKDSVIATLSFFDLFDFCLSLDEIEKFQLGKTYNPRSRLELYVKNSPKISQKQALFFLKDREYLLECREKKKKISEDFWVKVRGLEKKLQYLPYLRIVAVCNNLAYNNAASDSDIDLFIITKENRLFISRIVVTALLQILGLRRHGNKVSGRFCLSFFASESSESFAKIALKSDDIYLAYWLKTLKPIYGNKESFKKFEKKNNEFIRKFFPQNYKLDLSQFKKQRKTALLISKFLEICLNNFIGDGIEKILSSWQIKRALKKKALLKNSEGVIVNQNMLKFHNVDCRQEISEIWRKNLVNLTL